MSQYLYNVKELSKNFEDLEVIQIPKLESARADTLSHLATSDFSELNSNISIDVLEKSSIEALLIAQIEHEPSWIDPLMEYLTKGVLLANPVEARRIKRQVPWYVILDNQLYKRSYSSPLLQCLRPSEADYAL